MRLFIYLIYFKQMSFDEKQKSHPIFVSYTLIFFFFLNFSSQI